MNPELQKLVNDLAASKEYEGREQSKRSLAAVLDFLRTKPETDGVREPLIYLLAALEDADRGRMNDIIKPTNFGGTSRKLVRDSMQMAASSAAVSILREELGWSLGNALGAVARCLDLNKKEEKRLDEFRSNIDRGRAPEDAIEHFHFIRGLFHETTNFGPEERAQIILAKLRSMA